MGYAATGEECYGLGNATILRAEFLEWQPRAFAVPDAYRYCGREANLCGYEDGGAEY